MGSSRKPEDMTGKRFGRLVVIGQVPNPNRTTKEVKFLWKCLCDCGNETITRASNLRGGDTKSCGCILTEMRRSSGRKKKKHGMAGSKMYLAWYQMLMRCRNKNSISYKNYGGRGIKVCERWQEFKNFYEDMGDRPEGMSLDRIDVNGDYEPSNCRWASKKEQYHNRQVDQSIKDLKEKVDSLQRQIQILTMMVVALSQKDTQYSEIPS